MSTVRELAEHLGVSTATVSRALNDKPGVSQETRQKVLQLAKEWQYRPNLAARNLTTARTHNILFMIHRRQFPAAVDPFYPFILQGLEENLSNKGYSVTLVTINEDQMAAGPTSLRALQEHRADGIVLAGPDISPRFVLATTSYDLPTILVDNALSETPFLSVLADNQGGCQAATEHLINVHDHRSVTLLRGPAGWISSEERSAGYLSAMEKAGLQPTVVVAADTTVETGQEAMQRALDDHPETTAILAVNDAMAIGAMRIAGILGRQIPGDLAVIGFDDISWACSADPPLTSVSVPTVEMGRLAARMLLDRIEGTITADARTTVATRLIIRKSCGCSEDE